MTFILCLFGRNALDYTITHHSYSLLQVAEAAAKIAGIDKVLVAEDGGLKGQIAESVTAVMLDAQAQNSYTHILANGTVFGKVGLNNYFVTYNKILSLYSMASFFIKSALGTNYVNILQNILPRLGAKLDVAPISDIIGIMNDKTFVRTIYAGNAIQTVESCDSIMLLTVRGTSFEAAAAEGGSAEVEQCMYFVNSTRIMFEFHYLYFELQSVNYDHFTLLSNFLHLHI